MADYFVKNGGDGTGVTTDPGTGGDWSKSYATIKAALSGLAGAGDIVYVSDANANDYAGTTIIVGPSVAGSPVTIIMVQDLDTSVYSKGSPSAGYDGTNSNGDLDFSGHIISIGVCYRSKGHFNTSSTALTHVRLHDFIYENTYTSNLIRFIGSDNIGHSMIFSDMEVRSVNNAFIQLLGYRGTRTEWHGGLYNTTGNNTGDLISDADGGHFNVRGVDLSKLTGNFINKTNNLYSLDVHINNCKLAPGVTISSGDLAAVADEITIHNCDSSNTVLRQHYQDYYGITIEETIIVRTAGASDGTTPFALKLVSNAKPINIETYHKVKIADLWGDGTATSYGVEFVSDGVTLNDDELWIEVVYQDDLTTQGFIENDRVADIMTAGVAQPTSTETWITTGLATPIKQKCVVTLANTDKAGPVAVYACLAKPSTTVYACPKVEVV